MTDKREKAFEKHQETTIPAGATKDELSEKELENVTGGTIIKNVDKSTPL